MDSGPTLLKPADNGRTRGNLQLFQAILAQHLQELGFVFGTAPVVIDIGKEVGHIELGDGFVESGRVRLAQQL